VSCYAGIDWASEKHDVLIADEDGGRLLAETFVRDEDGIAALCGVGVLRG
jgi:Transposase